MRLSVLVPAYNEAATLREAIERVKGVDFAKEIIVVDDGSTDGTRAILEELKRQDEIRSNPTNEIKVLLESVNRGKGAAIRAGLSHVTGDVVIIQDADLEYDPQDYGRLLEPILSGKADVVYGTRFSGGGITGCFFFGISWGTEFSPSLATF